MPVDQSGENILFVMANGRVEAHVQIQYTGDPARFAWLVPIPAVPDVTVGSNQLFLNLLNATVPTFSVTNAVEGCGGGRTSRTSSSSGGCGMGSADSSAKSSFDGDGGSTGTQTNSDIAIGHESVGSFDVTILQPGSAEEVTAWLDANSFLYGSVAVPILQDYIDRGHVFVAVKLLPEAGVNEIHPLVFSYAGTEPCIPLKLTSVAATEDMAVRAFFLGDRRVFPLSYKEVTLNPERFDWVQLGSNYTAVVANAVDEPGADGHAFVTEYAGPNAPVSRANLDDTRWNAEPFKTAAPETVMQLLEQQGLVSCPPGGTCVANHPLVLPLVRRYLPAPAGMSESSFYSCLACNKDSIDVAAWDGAGFARDLQERVIAPGEHAIELLRTTTYATRLFTTISPSEMTEDPTFVAGTLADGPVSQNISATIERRCSGETALQIPGRSDAAMDFGRTPAFTASMPYALTIESRHPLGGSVEDVDNAAAIEDEIDSWNEKRGFDPNARRSAGFDDSDSMGCGCILGGGPAHPGHALGLLFVLSIGRRVFRRPGNGDRAKD